MGGTTYSGTGLGAGFSARRKSLPPIYESDTHWYQSWYFDLRLEEELSRARRCNLPMTVAVVCFPSRVDTAAPAFKHALRSIADTKLRRSDIPTALTSHELAICLTNTQRDQAAAVVNRLQKSLSRYEPSFGLASYPEDGKDLSGFLVLAEHRALESSDYLGPPATSSSESPDQP